MAERPPVTREDLPPWMRPHQRRLDIALIVIWGLCLVMALPWLSREGIPNSPNTIAQIGRITEIEGNLRAGDIYPRWSSHFHFGYGSPIFNYLAPLPHYLGGLHLLLSQGGGRFTLISLMALCLFIGGTGMFSIGRRLWGTLGGFIAALVYLLAPPLFYRAAYFDVDLSLVMAGALFPFGLWAADRALRLGDGREISGLGLIFALLILASNLMGPLLVILILIWAYGATWAIGGGRRSRRALLWGSVLSLGLSAFYWLPALLERGAVHWVEFSPAIRQLSLSEALLMPAAPDPRLLNPPTSGALGPATWMLGLLGGILAIVALRDKTTRPTALIALPFLACGLGLLAIAVGLPSAWLDSTSKFPALSRLDLLVPVAGCAAILAGFTGYIIETRLSHWFVRWAASMVVILASIGFAYPTLRPPAFHTYSADNPAQAILQDELRGRLSGSFLHGSLLPVEIQQMPQPSYFLLDSYARSQVVKIERASRLMNADLAILSHGPTHDSFQMNAPQPSNLDVLTLYFPGWVAKFNNQPIPVVSTPENGFIRVAIPEGTGRLDISFESTSPRQIGGFILVVTLLLIPLCIILLPRDDVSITQPTISLWQVGLYLLPLLIIFVARNNAPHGTQLNHIERYPLVFEGGIDMLGYDWGLSGDVLEFALYWQAARPNLPDYQVRVALVTPEGESIATEQHATPGGWLTSTWLPDKPVYDLYRLPLPNNLEAGAYTVAIQVVRCQNDIELYGCQDPKPLVAFSPSGQRVGETITQPLSIER